METVLGNPVGPDDPLMAAGLDSLGATELQQNLADTLGLELPSTLVFDYPTVGAMAEFLGGKLGGAQPGAELAVAGAWRMSGTEGGTGTVAIVGAGGQSALLQRWQRGDLSTRVPFGRWDVDSAAITGDGTLAAQVGRNSHLVCSAAVPTESDVQQRSN